MSYELTHLLNSSEKSITKMVNLLQACPSLSIHSLIPDQTALIIVDMVNGFVKEGPMSSTRIQSIIAPICDVLKESNHLGLKVVAFADSHETNCIEFNSYPAHCVKDTIESEIIDEIKETGHYQLIEKNSTNGFLESEFQQWLADHPMINQFVIVGDCTDICVEQFAITLKTYFNTINQPSRIIVPMSCVETYDFDVHDGDFMNVIALYKMMMNGIEIISHLEQ